MGPAWRTSHWLHTAFAVAAIGLYVLGGLAQSRVSGLPEDFPLERIDYPARVGTHVVHDEDELLARVAGEPVGYPLMVRGDGGVFEQRVDTRPLYTSFHGLVTRINGLFFLAVSLVVFAPRIDKVPARDLFWACLLYGLAVMIGGVYPPQGDTWPGALLPLVRVLALVVLPVLMFHVGLSFPRRTDLLDRLPWMMPAVIALGVILAIWQAWTWVRWFEGPGSWDAIRLPRQAGAVYLALFFGSGCAAMVFGYQRVDQEREREQVKWLLWGITMGAAPFVFLHALPLALGASPIVPVEVARLFSIVIPIAMSFVVIRHKFLDVDIIIRRSLLYVLLATMMVGVYALIGIFIGQRVEGRWPATGPFVPIVATIIAAMLFNPTRQGVAQLIDRVIFKIRYNHAQALANFRGELRQAEDQLQIVQGLTAFFSRHLRPRCRFACIRHKDKRHQAGDFRKTAPPGDLLPDGIRVMAIPGATARPDLETEVFPTAWKEEGFVVAHAIEAEGERFGYLLLGEKSTGRSYVAEDLDLLEAACREAALCAHRLHLKQDFVDEVVARHRIEEMNRFRSQFFAQFAHDLRSPLTSINWGARNLLDGVVGEVSAAQANYLEGIETSARQLVRLVNNLLEATRLESGLPEVEYSNVDLTATVEESISKLRVTAESKNLDLVVRTPDAALVRGNEEKLLEVIDNLIENAIRYAPPGTRVDVTVTRQAETICFEVADRGPGVDPDEIEAIFEPYRQGAPSPHSTQQGFGLGLFVVKSWISKMNGTVTATNRRGGGARFDFYLPHHQATNPQETA
jgi:signal transduction histidine kinase